MKLMNNVCEKLLEVKNVIAIRIGTILRIATCVWFYYFLLVVCLVASETRIFDSGSINGSCDMTLFNIVSSLLKAKP